MIGVMTTNVNESVNRRSKCGYSIWRQKNGVSRIWNARRGVSVGGDVNLASNAESVEDTDEEDPEVYMLLPEDDPVCWSCDPDAWRCCERVDLRQENGPSADHSVIVGSVAQRRGNCKRCRNGKPRPDVRM